jgi:hypothetical protein
MNISASSPCFESLNAYYRCCLECWVAQKPWPPAIALRVGDEGNRVHEHMTETVRDIVHRFRRIWCDDSEGLIIKWSYRFNTSDYLPPSTKQLQAEVALLLYMVEESNRCERSVRNEPSFVDNRNLPREPPTCLECLIDIIHILTIKKRLTTDDNIVIAKESVANRRVDQSQSESLDLLVDPFWMKISTLIAN